MLICGQFIAKDLILWSTLLFEYLEKLNFSNFWGPLNLLEPLKKTQLSDSWPLSMPWKTRPWGDLFENIVLYLMTVSFIRMWESFKRGFFLRKYGNCFGSKFKMSPSTVGTKGRKLRPGWFTTLFSFERISSASLLFKHWITSWKRLK